MKPVFLSLFFSLAACVTGFSEGPPEKKGLPFPGETLSISHRQAFLIPSAYAPAGGPKPWVWYAPTLPNLPGGSERWMFEKLLTAGIAIAGIDVGESYGSPEGRQGFSDLYTELTQTRGYSTKPAMLARSRGGLMTLAWAAENPGKVVAWAGIYPVSNIASYPGIQRAAPSYKLTEAELATHLLQHNPVDRLDALAKAGVPLFAIHGDSDKLVPLNTNSGLLKERYTALNGSMELIIPPGQGHNMWPGFFECEELVAFLKKHLLGKSER
jgi:pimeloyl-ACP methyl ester carboxylesterase